MALNLSMERFSAESSSALPVGLEWLVRAYCGEARARLASFDKDGALQAAKSAVELSCRSDPLLRFECLDIFAEVCAAKKDTNGELEALQSMFALPEIAELSRNVANRRRTWGFRLTKLERESLTP